VTEDSHRLLRESLGAYVLGHLDPADEDAVRTHLATCAECRAELAELQPVANALAGARRRPVLGGPAPRALQHRVEDAVAAEAGRRRRAHLVRSVTTLVAAAALVVVAVLGITMFIDRTPAAPVPETVAVQVASELDQVSATAGLIAHTWGVEVKLTTAGLAAGSQYQAFVLGENGGEVWAGTFTAIGEETMNCNLQSSVLRDQASGFEIRDQAGDVVISSDF
jgi:predicted anti-sigma-YlaC factor YlaD